MSYCYIYVLPAGPFRLVPPAIGRALVARGEALAAVSTPLTNPRLSHVPKRFGDPHLRRLWAEIKRRRR